MFASAILLLYLNSAAQSDSLVVKKELSEKQHALMKRMLILKVEIAAPLIGNPQWSQYNDYTTGDEDYDPWFLPAGLNLKAGAGIRFAKNFAVGIAGGIESRLDHKLVVAPVFADLTANTPSVNGHYALVNVGLGKSFAIGRNGLSGMYRRISIGFGNPSANGFLELSQYAFQYKGMTAVTNVSIGAAVRF